MKVAVYSYRAFDEGLYFEKIAKELGMELVLCPDAPDMENAALAEGCDYLSVITTKIDAALVERFHDLGVKMISTRTIGYDHIDLKKAKELGVKMPVGNLYSSDTFYDAAGRNDRMRKMGVMAVEMEAAALYCTAAYLGKRALAICSISDNLVLGTELTPEERQSTFTNMMKIGLEAAVKMARQD